MKAQYTCTILSFEFPPKTGGAGEVAKAYAIALAEKGNKIHVISCNSNVAESNKYYSHDTFKYSMCWPLKMYKLAPKSSNCYILNDPGAVYCAGLFFSKKKLSNSIVFMHGGELERIFGSLTLKRKLTGFRQAYLRVLKYCKRIVLPSFYFSEQFSKVSCFSNDYMSKVEVVYAPIKKTYQSLNPNDEYERVGISLLSVSRIVEKKGYGIMYKIIKKLKESGVDVSWDVVGEGRYLQKLQQEVKKDSLEDTVAFHGRLDGDELLHIYGKADLFILLSEFNESYGLVYLESLSQGVPVVAYKRAGPGEIISSKCGFLVNNPDEVELIIKSKKYKSIKSQECINYASKFFGEGSVTKLNEIIVSPK